MGCGDVWLDVLSDYIISFEAEDADTCKHIISKHSTATTKDAGTKSIYFLGLIFYKPLIKLTSIYYPQQSLFEVILSKLLLYNCFHIFLLRSYCPSIFDCQ